jgi:hypothetical protein
METIKPLPNRILNRAKELKITTIGLFFSGGSDEGYLTVSLFGGKYDNDLVTMVEDWAWSAYSYSGAGVGNDYGDDIFYDLVNNVARVSEWHMERHEGRSEEIALEVDDEKN